MCQDHNQVELHRIALSTFNEYAYELLLYQFFLKIEITTTPSLGKYKNSCIVSGAQLLVKFAKLSGT